MDQLITARLQDFHSSVISPEISQNREVLHLELIDDLAKLTTRIDSLKNSYDVDRLKKDFHQNEIADLKTLLE